MFKNSWTLSSFLLFWPRSAIMFFSSWFCCSHCFMSYLPYFHCHSNKTFFIEEIVNSRNSQNWTNPGNTVTRAPNALQCIVLKWLYNWVKIKLNLCLTPNRLNHQFLFCSTHWFVCCLPVAVLIDRWFVWDAMSQLSRINY